MAYAYVRTCTVNHALCGASDSTNFPVLVSVTDVTLALVASGGHIHNYITSTSVGKQPTDLAFYLDAALTQPLAFEVEHWDDQFGVLVAWVRVPTLTHSSDLVFYLAYSDAAVTTYQGSTSTWSSAFECVYHGLDVFESTSHLRALTQHGGTGTNTSAGYISSGATFNGATGAYLSTPSFAQPASALTIQFAVKPVNFTSVPLFVAGWDGTSADYFQCYGVSGQIGARVYQSAGNYIGRTTASGAMSTGAWTLVHVVWTGGTTNSAVQIYLNGVQADTTNDGAGTFTAANSITRALLIGSQSTGGANNLNGLMDEIRELNVALSADWITADSNTQRSPGTFLTLGAETPTTTPTIIRVTQDAIEAVTQSAPALRVTQAVVEVLNGQPTTARVTQDALELLSGITAIRVTQDAVELLNSATPAVRMTQDVVELLAAVAAPVTSRFPALLLAG